MKGELETKDNQLSGITSELERLREDQHSLKGEVEDRGNAIVTLQTELEKVMGEVLERDVAIANLKTELEAREDKQLPLFPMEPTQPTAPEPTPTPEPVTISPVTEPTPTPTPEPKSKVKSKPKTTPEPEPEPIPLILLDTIEGTVPRIVIMDRILEIDPATEINGQIITDAVLGKNQRLSELETTYGFKFVGYVMKGQKREYRYKLA